MSGREVFGVIRWRQVLAGLALVLVGLTGVDPAGGRGAGATAATPAGATQATAGRVKEFALTVGRVGWELAPGQATEAYAYNRQVPGPELRVTEGDTVRVG